MNTKTNTKRLAESAMLIALATILSLVKLFNLPFGGDITVASMAPIVIIAFYYGTGWGLFSAFVFSLIQLLTGMQTVSAFFLPGDSQLVLWQALAVCFVDYILAYTVLGFAGIFKGKIKNNSLAICLGSLFATTLRYICHIVSGYIFFGAWAEWFFGQEGFALGAKIMTQFSGKALSMVYSVFYNGLYMIPEIIITAIVAPLIYRVIFERKGNRA